MTLVQEAKSASAAEHFFTYTAKEAREILRTAHGIAIVAGDTGSVGSVAVQRLLSDGHPVVGVNSGRRPERVEDLIGYAKKRGVPYGCFTLDFRRPEEIAEALGNDVALEPSRIDYLLIASGRNHNGTFGEFTPSQLRVAFEEHVVSPYLLAQRLVAGWEKINTVDRTNPARRHRGIAYVSSVARQGGSPAETPYVIAKGAAEAAMLTLHREGIPYGITAVVIRPGLIVDSEMGRETVKKRPDVLGRIPGEPTTAWEVAEAAITMMKLPSASGHVYALDGGRTTSI